MRNTLISQIEKAVRQNFIPGLILWCIGLILVFCFYFLDASRPWFQLVIEWKKQYGFFYSGVSTALFGGVIPYLFLRVSGRGGFGSNWIHGVIFILYWALRGVDVDAFYRFQAWLFIPFCAISFDNSLHASTIPICLPEMEFVCIITSNLDKGFVTNTYIGLTIELI